MDAKLRTAFVSAAKLDDPKDVRLFTELSQLGEELIALHLLESPKLAQLSSTYEGISHPEIGRVTYENGTVWLDDARLSARFRIGSSFCAHRSCWNAASAINVTRCLRRCSITSKNAS
jgi:hypothetical protein